MYSLNTHTQSRKPLLSPLKRYGGKAKLAKRLASLCPSHRTYVEPYAGAASLLFSKAPSQVEVINDADADLMLLWRTMQNPVTSLALAERLTAHANTKDNYIKCLDGYDKCVEPIERAYRYFVLTQCSFNALFARGWSRATHKSHLTAFPNRVARLPMASTRLQRVEMHCGEAISVIEATDSPDTLFYLDPPYVHATRVVPKRYEHEMTDFQHKRMLSVLINLKGMVILSGYQHPMYDDLLIDWQRVAIPVTKHGGSTKVKVNETLWLNPACSEVIGSRAFSAAA